MQLVGPLVTLAVAAGAGDQLAVPTPGQSGTGMAWAAHMLGLPVARAAAGAALGHVRRIVEPTPLDTAELRQQISECGVKDCDFALTRSVLAAQLSSADAGEAGAMLQSMLDVWDVVAKTADLCTPDLVVRGVHEAQGLLGPARPAEAMARILAKRRQAEAFVRDALCPAVYGALLTETDEAKLALYVSVLADRTLPGCFELYAEEDPSRLARFGGAVVDTAVGATRVVRRGGERIGAGLASLAVGARDLGAQALGTARGALGTAGGWVSGLAWGGRRSGHEETLDEGLLEVAARKLVVVRAGPACPLEPARVADVCLLDCTCVPLVLSSGDATKRLYDAGAYKDPQDDSTDWSAARRQLGQALVVYDDASYVYSFTHAARSLAAAIGASFGAGAAGTAAVEGGTAAVGSTAVGSTAVGSTAVGSTAAAVGTAAVGTAGTVVAVEGATAVAAGTTVAEGATATVASTGTVASTATVAGVAVSAAALIGGFMHLKARVDQHDELFGEDGLCTFAAGLVAEDPED